MSSIDKRIVEMKFDNKQFETGIATSIESLDKLKKSLQIDDALRGIASSASKAAREFSLDAITTGIDALTKRFSTLGIIGMRVLENLTDAAMKFGAQAWSFVYNAIVGGGKRRAFNIENAHFQLQGLLKDEEKVQAIMADAMDSVDGTAYAYDEAAKAASQFAASGLEAGKEMQSALRAITGVAAMTNSEYEDISRVFTTVAGNGRLMGDQLLQLSSRGLNAAASLAEYLTGVSNGSIEASEDVTAAIKAISHGTEVTEADIRDMVSKGKLSFRIFSAAMDDAFGEHAKKANETFTGAMSNVKAAFARIGAEFISPLVVQNGPLVQLLNEIRKQVNALKKGIVPIAQVVTTGVNNLASKAAEFVKTLNFDKVFESVYNLFYVVRNLGRLAKEVLAPIKQAFNDIFPDSLVDKIASISQSLNLYFRRLSVSAETADRIRRIFSGVFAVFDIGRQLFKNLVSGLVDIIKYISPSSSGILEFAASIGDFLVNLRDTISTSDVFGTAIEKVVGFIKRAIDATKSVYASIKNFVITAKDSVTEFYGVAKEKVSKFPWLEAFLNLIKAVRRQLTRIVDFVKKVKSEITSSLDNATDKLTTSNFIKALQTLWEVVKKVFSLLVKAFGDIGKALADALARGDIQAVFDTFTHLMTALLTLNVFDFVNVLKTSSTRLLSVGLTFKKVMWNMSFTLQTMQAKIKADAIMKIALAVGVLAASVLVLSTVDVEGLAASTTAILALVEGMVAAMAILSSKAVGRGEGLLGIINGFGDGRRWQSLSTAMIKMAAAILILAVALERLSKLSWEEIARGLTAVAGLAVIVSGMLYALSKTSGKAIKGATSAVILAAALTILVPVCERFAAMDNEGILKALYAVGLLIAEMALFTQVAKSKLGAATSVVILAAGLRVIMLTVEDLAKMNWGNIGKALTALGAILLELGAFSNLVKSNVMASTGLVIFAASLRIFMQTFTEFSGMDFGSLQKGLVAFGGLLLELGTFMAILGKSKGSFGKSVGLVVVAASLEIFVDVLKKMTRIPMNSLNIALMQVGVALLELAVGLHAMKGTAGGTASLLLATVALAGMTAVLKAIGSIPINTILTGLVAIAGIFATLGVAGAALGPMAGTILSLSASLVVLGAGLTLVGVGLISIGSGLTSLGIGIAAFNAGLVTGFALLPEAIKVMLEGIIAIIRTFIRGLGGIVTDILNQIKLVMPILAETIYTLIHEILVGVHIDQLVEDLMNLVESLLASLAQHTGPIVDSVMTILIDACRAIKERIPELVVEAVGIIEGIITGLKQAFSGLSAGQVAEFLLVTAGLTVIFAFLASIAPDVKKAAINVGLMILLVGSLTLCYVALGQLDNSTTLAISTALAEVIVALTGALFLLQNVPVTGALKAVASMDIMIANLTAVLVALGAIYRLGDVKELIDDGGKLLSSIGYSIGEFVGSIIGGFAGGISSGFPVIAQNLSSFGEQIQPFVESMSGIDADSMKGVKYLTEAILLLTGAELLDGLASFVGGVNFNELGQEIEEFAPHLTSFYEACSGIDPEVVEIAGYAAAVIAEFVNKIPKTGGLLQKVTGENDIVGFGQALADFGPDLKSFGDSVVGLDTTAVEKAADSASIIADFANKIPATGGIISSVTGDNDIVAFGEQLKAFGPSIVQFGEDVADLDNDAVDKAGISATMLAELADKLPNTGGLVQWFEGEVSLSEFGDGLVDLGTALKSFGESIDGINNDDISATAAVANELVVLSTSVSDWLDSSLNLSTFGGQISDFGSHLQTYWGETKNISTPFLSALTAEIKKLVDVANTLSSGSGSALESFGNGLKSLGESGIQNFADSITGSSGTLDSAISTMMSSVVSSISNKKGEVLTAFGNVMSDASDKVGSYKVNFATTGTNLAQSLIDGIKLRMLTMSTSFSNSIIAVINNINAKKTSFNNAGSGLMDSLISGIKTKSLTVNSTFTSVINSIVSTIQSKYSTLSDLGSTCLEKFSSGFSTNGTTLSSSITSAISVAVSAIKSYYNSFYNAGDYLVTGFVNGISDNIWRAKAKAVAMAEAALNGARDRLKIQSPSKEFYKIGNFAGLGLVNALNEYEEKAYEAGDGMGAGAMSGLQSAVSKAASIIEEGIDSTPTIRPVMDLSEIQNGTNRLYSMMNDVNGYALSGSIGIAGTTAAGMNQMKAFSEIDPTELALNNLMNAISGMPTGDTYDNKFYITGDNPQEIAEEVSRILRLQVERRNAVWA